MRLRRRRQEPLSDAEAASQLYGDYVREPHRQAVLEVAPRSAPVETIKAANDEELAWSLNALDSETRRLVLLRPALDAFTPLFGRRR